MRSASFSMLADLIEDPVNGWSIGSFGAIGEFMREADEPCDLDRRDDRIEAVTARGAIRVVAAPLRAVAWDSLSPDGESWGHEIGFCMPRAVTPRRTVQIFGTDDEAVRASDRHAMLFDLGIAAGCIRMCVRTDDAALIALLTAALGKPFFAIPGIMEAVMRVQPHRVMLSPAGRIEVFQPIPSIGGQSPIGPHTHVLPHVACKDRSHSSNIPIPQGWQAALSMHPKSPWYTPLGKRHAYEPVTDAQFAPLLSRFGLDEDAAVAVAVATALGGRPERFEWPETRRGRHKARITLRRLAVAGDPRVTPWREMYDRAGLRD